MSRQHYEKTEELKERLRKTGEELQKLKLELEQTQEIQKLEAFQLRKIEYLVFAGGGAKGGLYSGVFSALEENQIIKDVIGMSGSSAGSIIAALIATGGSAKDVNEFICNLEFPKLLDSDKKFLPPYDGIPLLRKLTEIFNKNIQNGIKKLFCNNNFEALREKSSTINEEELKKYTDFLKSRFEYLTEKSRSSNPGNSAEKLDELKKKFKVVGKEEWNNEELRRFFLSCLFPEHEFSITFDQLRLLSLLDDGFKELYITTTNKQTGDLFVMHHKSSPTVTISEACRASSALPGVIKPYKILGEECIDGGYRSNIPYISEIEEKVKDGKSRVLIFVFDTQGRANKAIYHNGEIISKTLPIRFAELLLEWRFSGKSSIASLDDDLRKVREHALCTVVLKSTPIETLNFETANDLKELLFIFGYFQICRYLYNHRLPLHRKAGGVLNLKESDFLELEFLVNVCIKCIFNAFITKGIPKPPAPKFNLDRGFKLLERTWKSLTEMLVQTLISEKSGGEILLSAISKLMPPTEYSEIKNLLDPLVTMIYRVVTGEVSAIDYRNEFLKNQIVKLLDNESFKKIFLDEYKNSTCSTQTRISISELIDFILSRTKNEGLQEIRREMTAKKDDQSTTLGFFGKQSPARNGESEQATCQPPKAEV